VFGARARRGSWLGLLGLATLAISGQAILNQAAVTIGRSQRMAWNVFTPGFDFLPIWTVGRSLVHGGHADGWYGPGTLNWWPPPHEVLLAPLGFLDYAQAHLVTILLTTALIVFVVALWSSEGPIGHRWPSSIAWPLLLSAPVVAVVWIDQLQAALGLAALSLAIWAQRRDKWWLAGIAAAVGTIRILNAIPIVCILLLAGWRKPRQLAVAGAGAVALMAPLLLVSYLVDHAFISNYLAASAAYPIDGLPKVANLMLGPWGLPLLMVVGCAAAVWVVRQDAGRPLDPGRAAFALGLTVPLATVPGLYPAIFTVPALIMMGKRPGYRLVPWIATVAPWAVIIALAPWLLGAEPGLAMIYMSLLDYGLLLLAFPILRHARQPEPALAAA
jgi:hypothetical protein